MTKLDNHPQGTFACNTATRPGLSPFPAITVFWILRKKGWHYCQQYYAPKCERTLVHLLHFTILEATTKINKASFCTTSPFYTSLLCKIICSLIRIQVIKQQPCLFFLQNVMLLHLHMLFNVNKSWTHKFCRCTFNGVKVTYLVWLARQVVVIVGDSFDVAFVWHLLSAK